MLGDGFLKRSASDPERIRDAGARARRVVLCMIDLHIGNFAIATPVIKALQRGFGARDDVSAVDVIVARGFVPLAKRLLDPTTIIGHDMPRSLLGDAAGLMRTRRLTHGRYDLLIGISGGVRGSTLARFAGVRDTVGLDRYRRSGLYTLLIKDENPATALGRYAQFGALLTGTGPIIEPFTPIEDDDEKAVGALQAAGIDPDEPLTIFHPGAGKAHRLWPVDRFARIADHVIDHHGHTVGVLTAPGEESTTDALLGAMSNTARAHRLSAPLDLLMPIFDRAGALVCNESGPMHLAAMTRCAIVALFGPTDPVRWAPIRTGPEVAVLSGDACPSACRGGSCVADGACLTSISVERVAGALDRTLAAADALQPCCDE